MYKQYYNSMKEATHISTRLLYLGTAGCRMQESNLHQYRGTVHWSSQSVQSMRIGRPSRFLPFNVAAFSHASVFQNSTKPLHREERKEGRHTKRWVLLGFFGERDAKYEHELYFQHCIVKCPGKQTKPPPRLCFRTHTPLKSPVSL